MNKVYMTHSGAEFDEAIDQYQESLVPTGTLPAQVNLHASLDPLTPKVNIDWQFKDENAEGIVICRKKGEYPAHASDGRIVDIPGRTITSYVDDNFPEPTDEDFSDYVGVLGAPVKWYYRAFPYNTNRQYQTQYQASIELGVQEINAYYMADGTRMSDLTDDALLDVLVNGEEKPNPIKIYFGRWGTSASTVKDLCWSVKHIDRTNNNAHLVIKNSFIGTVAYDAAENTWPDTTYNTGNARWSYSNARQFLNATGAKGEWYTPQHEHDHATSYSFSQYDGFLHYFTEGERALIKTQTRRLYLATNPYGGGTETVDDDVFLLNTKEYGMEPNSDESGPVYDGFPTNADRAWSQTVWTSTIYQHNSYNYLWLCSSAGALRGNSGGGSYASGALYSVRAGLVIPLDTLLQYDAEASALEGCDVYRVVIPEEENAEVEEEAA